MQGGERMSACMNENMSEGRQLNNDHFLRIEGADKPQRSQDTEKVFMPARPTRHSAVFLGEDFDCAYASYEQVEMKSVPFGTVEP